MYEFLWFGAGFVVGTTVGVAAVIGIIQFVIKSFHD